MRALLLTLGILLLVAAGAYVPVGPALLQAARLPYLPPWLPYAAITLGAALVLESSLRFADK